MQSFVAVLIVMCGMTASALADGCCQATQPAGTAVQGTAPFTIRFELVPGDPNQSAGVPVNPGQAALNSDIIRQILCGLLCGSTSPDDIANDDDPIRPSPFLEDDEATPDITKSLGQLQTTLDGLSDSIETLQQSIDSLAKDVKALRKKAKRNPPRT